MNALNELRELDASLEGEEDINSNGGPNTAMRVRQVLAEVIPAVAELIAADAEYDEANSDWEHATSNDPLELSDETWRRVADRFESAVMRRIAALAKVQP